MSLPLGPHQVLDMGDLFLRVYDELDRSGGDLEVSALVRDIRFQLVRRIKAEFHAAVEALPLELRTELPTLEDVRQNPRLGRNLDFLRIIATKLPRRRMTVQY